MDYFCYISRSKIDQLFQTISPAEVDEWTESRTTEQNLNADMGADFSFAHIVSLFKSGITYGRKNLVQREKKIKIQYTEKLQTVLLAITKENPIQPISSAIETEHLSSMFYHHTGVFKIKEPLVRSSTKSDCVITILAEIAPNHLLLDCSLRFFSDGNEPNGDFHIHSGNWRFFSGDIGLEFETVFMLLGHKENNIFGTPLFLKLSGIEGYGASL